MPITVPQQKNAHFFQEESAEEMTTVTKQSYLNNLICGIYSLSVRESQNEYQNETNGIFSGWCCCITTRRKVFSLLYSHFQISFSFLSEHVYLNFGMAVLMLNVTKLKGL